MIVCYLILVIVSILFKVLHWPGYSLFLLISPLIPFLDIFIQMLRNKTDKLFRVLSSLAFFGISVFLLFRMLSWPGSNFMFIFFIITCLPLIIVLSIKGFRLFKGYRPIALVVLILFSLFTLTLSPSEFQLTFMAEDPFDQNEIIPHFIRHEIAFKLFAEGKKDQALKLLEITLKDHEKNCTEWLSQELCEKNKVQLRSDIEAVKNNSWTYREQLYY